MSTDISNTADIIDSRDILERIEELTATLEDPEFYNDGDSDEQEELDVLNALIEELEQVSGDSPEDGATLISDNYFVDYAKELLEDCGYIPADLPGWITIDWEDTADNMKADYSEVSYDGAIYWVRS